MRVRLTLGSEATEVMPASKRVLRRQCGENVGASAPDVRKLTFHNEAAGGAAPPAGRSCEKKRSASKLSGVSVKQYQIGRGLDHALVVSGSGGLAAWKALPERCRLLSATEHRYVVDAPGPWDDYTAPVWRRICVKDYATGAKRFEVPVGATMRRRSLLVAFHDEHGVQLSLLQKLMAKMKLRLVSFRDPFHRYWRDLILSAKEAGLWPDVLEFMHVMNLPFGPWKTAKWWQEMRDVMADHFANNDRFNALFQTLYVHLQREAVRNGRVDAPLDTDEAAGQVWSYLRSVTILKRKGFRVKTKTWFELVKRLDKFRLEHFAVLYVLCVLCHSQGHFSTTQDMPIFGCALPPAVVSVLPGDAEHSRKDPQGKHGARMRSLRARCQNACVVAAMCQGQAGALARANLFIAVARPVWTAFARDEIGLTGENQVCERYVAYSVAGQRYVTGRIWHVLRDASSLAQVFDVPREERVDVAPSVYKPQVRALVAVKELKAPAALCARPVAQWLADLAFHDEHGQMAELAEVMWKFAAHLAKHRCLSMGAYVSIPPGQFAALLASKASLRREALQEQRANWDTLLDVEDRMHGDRNVADIVKAIGFLFHDIPREILAALAQHDFQIVPPDVLNMLDTMFRGFGSSRMNEKNFNAVKDTCRLNKDIRKTNRVMRHYIPSLLRVLPKQFQRAEVECGASEPAPGNRSVQKEDFEALAGEFSMGDEELVAAISTDSRDVFPCTTAIGLRRQVAAWRLLRHCNALPADWARVGNSWHALLLPCPGVARRESDGSHHIVMETTEHGALLWPSERFQEGGLTWFRPSLAPGAAPTWATILSTREWRACEVAALCPEVHGCFLRAAVPGGPSVPALGQELVVLARHPMQDLWSVAAYAGFQWCGDKALSAAITHLKLNDGVAVAARPKLILEKVEVLTKWALPSISDEQLASVILARAGLATARRRPSLLLDGDALSKAQGCFVAKDFQEIQTFQRDELDRREALHASSLDWLLSKGYISAEVHAQEKKRATRKPASEPAPTGGAAQPAKKPQHGRKKVEYYTESWVRANVIPQRIKGCTITHVCNVHATCWTAKYPGAASKTKAYGDTITSEAACDTVCMWQWQRHIEKCPGAVCPWDFPSALPLRKSGAAAG